MNCEKNWLEKHSLTLYVSLYVKQVRNHHCKAFTATQTCHVCLGASDEDSLSCVSLKINTTLRFTVLIIEYGYTRNKTLVKYSLLAVAIFINFWVWNLLNLEIFGLYPPNIATLRWQYRASWVNNGIFHRIAHRSQ